MSKKREQELQDGLRKLEKTSKCIVETRGYTNNTKKVNLLDNLIRSSLRVGVKNQ